MTIEKPKEKTIEIPFKLARKLIVVNILLDDTERPFIFDTGASSILLNSVHLPTPSTGVFNEKSVEGADINGEAMNIQIHEISSFDIHGIRLENENLPAADIAHLEKELEIESYGLIGYNLLKEYDILFDYSAKKITLIAPDEIDSFLTEHKKQLVVPFQLKLHLPIIEASIHGETYHFGLDSGAEGNLIDESKFDDLKAYLKNMETDTIMGGNGKEKEAHKGELKEVVIGGQSFEDCTTLFGDISPLNEAYQLNIDGLIGYPILSQQPTLLSYSRNELIFL